MRSLPVKKDLTSGLTYLSKGIDLSGLSQSQLNAIARQLSQRPRKTLGFYTPAAWLGHSGIDASFRRCSNCETGLHKAVDGPLRCCSCSDVLFLCIVFLIVFDSEWVVRYCCIRIISVCLSLSGNKANQ